MRLHEIIYPGRWVWVQVAEKQFGITLWRDSEVDERQIRIRFDEEHRRISEHRYFPDKHNCWSDWKPFGGFTVDDMLADDWRWA